MKQKNKYSCRIKRKLSHAFKKKKKRLKGLETTCIFSTTISCCLSIVDDLHGYCQVHWE